MDYMWRLSGNVPIANEQCRLATRTVRPGVSVSCCEMQLPPPAVRLIIGPSRCNADGAVGVRVKVSATSYTKTNQCCELMDWTRCHVCICDATAEEMELVLKTKSDAAGIREAAWNEKVVEIRQKAQRAQKAAATRRANERKRKIDAVCSGDESENE